MSAYYENTNGVPLDQGRTTHLGLRAGELAPRIVCCGSLSRPRRTLCSGVFVSGFLTRDPGRRRRGRRACLFSYKGAVRLRALLDAPERSFELSSTRGFTTFTGMYRGVAVSVCAVGMGGPMMDFFVREARAIVDGPMVILRYGSCGGLAAASAPGVVVVNTGSIEVRRDPDACAADAGASSSYYAVTRTVARPDCDVQRRVLAALRSAVGTAACITGLNASCDSFYASQGRRDPNFADHNEALVDDLRRTHPDLASMEMESFTLLHLASAAIRAPIRACTAAIVCANRDSADVITVDRLHDLEARGGGALLAVLAETDLATMGFPAPVPGAAS